MKTIALSLALITILSGCVTIPSKEDLADFNRRNDVSPSSSGPQQPRGLATTSLVPDTNGARMIIVGNVMALAPLDASGLNQRYETLMQPKEATVKQTVSREWYLATNTGETQVVVSRLPGFYYRSYKVAVPKDLARKIRFASAFDAAMFGSSGDLVVAQATAFGIWITHVLCSEKDPNFAVCERQYQRGVYQGVDGREIDGHLHVKDGGAVIDTKTFEPLTSR